MLASKDYKYSKLLVSGDLAAGVCCQRGAHLGGQVGEQPVCSRGIVSRSGCYIPSLCIDILLASRFVGLNRMLHGKKVQLV